MTLSKSQKIWIGFLGIGVCALGYDQFAGDATTLATAASVVGLVTGDTTVAPLSATDAAAAKPQTLAARLAALAATLPPGETRDAFSTPVQWKPPEAAVEVAKADPAADFAKSHSLKGVFESNGVGHAMIDGRLLAVGQSIDGFKLIAVGHLRATFRDGDRTAVLAMQDAALAKPPKKQQETATVFEIGR